MSDLLNDDALRKHAEDLLLKKRALLFQQLQAKKGHGSAAQVIRSRRNQAETSFPLSFAQERLWFLEQLQPESGAYHVPIALRLVGTLDVAALLHSLQAIVQRHEILRTTFPLTENQPCQVIADRLDLTLPQVDLTMLDPVEQANETQRLIRAAAEQPFDLTTGPLLRVGLLRLRPDEHMLLLTMHHIITDGWSSGVLIREMTTFYTAAVHGVTAHPTPLTIQYADYAFWQREHLQGDILTQQVNYWQTQLANLSPLQLPTDYPRPVVQRANGGTVPIEIDAVLTVRLHELSQQANVTLFMSLLTAWNVLLHRYSGQADIAVGTPIAGRTHRETEPLIGCFVNTLVVRTDLSGNPTFWDLLQRIRSVTLEAYAHQAVPFEVVVKAVQPERDLSRSPLVQVLISLQNTPSGPLIWPGLDVHPLIGERTTAKFDLTLDLTETPAGLVGVIEFATDLFERETIRQIANHLQLLLAAMVDDPTRRIIDLPLLTTAEHRKIVIDWNTTQQAYPYQRGIHELFVEQAQRTPQAIAVVFQDRQLTYAELDSRSDQLAHMLRSRGVGPETRVGLCVDRSIEMVIGLLGILKAGGAYLPLDPAYPTDRLMFVFHDAEIAVLLTQRHLLANLPQHPQPICLDEAWDQIAPVVTTDPLPAVQPDQLAYIIYTSGSTGHPKGVQIAHRSVVNFLYAMRKDPGLTNQDRLLAVTTLSFDIAGLELFLPLIVGGRVVIVPREDVANGERLATLLAATGTTVMQATPATWQLLIQAEWMGTPHLRIFCGGEAFPPELAFQMLARGATVWNMYGPTETTIWSTTIRVKHQTASIPIGRPIANTQVYVLDQQFQPVPIGVPGELYIGGDGVARGYLNRPALTAEKFPPDPFSRNPGTRLYRTGDLVRYRADGVLEYLGRLDDQVKLRGYRIELGEIEAVLRRYPAVQEAVVVVREDRPADTRLVAYLVAAAKDAPPTIDDIRAHLLNHLPPYMLPSIFILLEALPLTPNGKVDRKALPLPGTTQSASRAVYEAPRTELEQMLARIWAEVLDVDQVGLHDNFFELGGHSLLLTRMHRQIQEQVGRKLSLVDLFKYPTIAALTEYLSSTPDATSSFAKSRTRGAVRGERLQQQQHLRQKQRKLN